MEDRVKVLGVNVDAIKLDKILNATNLSLNNDGMDIIYFASALTALTAEEEEEFAAFVDSCDLVIPGDKNIERLVMGKEAESKKVITGRRYLERLLTTLNKNEKSVFFLMETQEQLKMAKRMINTDYPDVIYEQDSLVEGMTTEDQDLIVNNINAAAPDVLLLIQNGRVMQDFIENSRTKMNVKLCLCLENLAGSVLDEIILVQQVPGWAKRLHLGKWFKWIFDRKKLHTTLINHDFNKQLKVMDDKKENDNGDNQTKTGI